MRTMCVGLLLVEFAVSAAAAEAVLPEKDWPEPARVIRLWPGDAPGLVPSTNRECIVKQRIRNVSVPELWLYFPQKEEKGRAVLMICPGGGYGHLGMGLHVGNVVRPVTEQGIVVMGLKYRLRYGTNNVAEDAVMDCERAIRLIRHHAGEWGVDPARVAVQGYSAGGNVCLNLLGRADGGNPAAEDPVERQSSRPDLVALMCPWANGRKIEDYPVVSNPPPVFIASAEDDRTATTEFAREIGAAVGRQGGKVTMFVVPTGGHGAFHYSVVDGPGARWPDTLLPMIRALGAAK